MNTIFNYPFDIQSLLTKKSQIKRELLQQKGLVEKKVAILGGSTTDEIKKILELFLLNVGIKPAFYESAYNRYYEDVLFDNDALKSFAPDIIYIHTTHKNINQYPRLSDTAKTINNKFEDEIAKFTSIWEKIQKDYNAVIIQNNFDLPDYRTLGNLNSVDARGQVNFIMRLNDAFSQYAQQNKKFLVNDIFYLSSWLGLKQWFDPAFWYSYKYAMSYDAMGHLAENITSLIKAVYGKSKKCLVLDLDNTLWGGVIGEVGVGQIQLGEGDPVSEAYLEFQKYIKQLKDMGIILSVCSKNNEDAAKEGLSHPESQLRVDDFSAFRANWDSKDKNISEIADELNIGLDSMVFIDDNASERDLIKAQLPEVHVLDGWEDISDAMRLLDRSNLFVFSSLSQEDLKRSKYYSDNIKRKRASARFKNYGEFLSSLEMKAEIEPFHPTYLERITQLASRTNQFNLTTKRYHLPEIENICHDNNYITLQGRLTDKFGDNGLISLIIGRKNEQTLHIDLWLMNCRVIKRDMELAMMDCLVEECQAKGIKTIVGYYLKSAKNQMVADFYPDLGFQLVEQVSDDHSQWQFDVGKKYKKKNKHIWIGKQKKQTKSKSPSKK